MTNDSRGPKARGYQRLAHEDAARRGLTPEEYGVYKGSEGRLVKPVNSATGLLIMSIVLTVIMSAVLVFAVIIIAQSLGLVPIAPASTEMTPVMWFFVAITFVFPVWSWMYYFKERKAQKLRIARGLPKNLS